MRILYKIFFMPIYYYLFLFITASILIITIRSLVLRKKDIPSKLYTEALKNENSGHLKAAVVIYENALHEVKKNRFHGGLRNKILEKLKVLHTVIAYETMESEKV